jgi:hypothetical protein
MRHFWLCLLFLGALSTLQAYQLAWKDAQIAKRCYQWERTTPSLNDPAQMLTLTYLLTETTTGVQADGTATLSREYVFKDKLLYTESFDRRANGEKLNYQQTPGTKKPIWPDEEPSLRYMTSLNFPAKDLAPGDTWQQDVPVPVRDLATPATMKATYTLTGTKEIDGKTYPIITLSVTDKHMGLEVADRGRGKSKIHIEVAIEAQILWDTVSGAVYSAVMKYGEKSTSIPAQGSPRSSRMEFSETLTKVGADVIAPAVLKLATTPAGATVLVDGVSQPQATPCTVTLPFADFTPRTVKLEIRLDGYRTITANGNLKPGETKNLTLTLKPAQ